MAKILIYVNPSVQRSYPSGGRRNPSPGEMCGLSHWHTHTNTGLSSGQSRQKKVQDASYRAWSRMNAPWTPSLAMHLLPARKTTFASLWWKRNTFNPSSKLFSASNVGPLTWAHKGKKKNAEWDFSVFIYGGKMRNRDHHLPQAGKVAMLS